MKKIIYISDFNMGGADSAANAVPRSGYANIGIELCRGLSNNGYEVKVMGLGYTGQEHREPFTIVPCQSLQDVAGYVNNLKFLNGVDAVVVALDIHHFQEQLFPAIKKLEIPYVCITPLESDPLCIEWANLLSQMDKVFFISEFGAQEAQKAGVDAEHIEIGIDTKAWRLRTKEEYEKIRKNMGYEPDDFVVITVADNQERKDLSGGYEAIDKLKKLGVSAKLILVTREHSMVGWKLHSMPYDHELGIAQDVRTFQSGMPFSELYMLYSASDVYMSCSKGEGLGLPVMEAMCVGLPVVANKTGALPELLADGRGWVVDYMFSHIDPFGNQRRYYVDRDKMAKNLLDVKNMDRQELDKAVGKAREYMENRNWGKSVAQLQKAIEEICGA